MKKPKPADRKPAGGKPAGKPGGPSRDRKPYEGKFGGDRPPRRENDGSVTEYKGRGDRPKGPPPPEGRPDSKKNIARAAARANAGDPSQSMRKPRAGASKPGGKFKGKPGGKPGGKFGGKPGGKR